MQDLNGDQSSTQAASVKDIFAGADSRVPRVVTYSFVRKELVLHV